MGGMDESFIQSAITNGEFVASSDSRPIAGLIWSSSIADLSERYDQFLTSYAFVVLLQQKRHFDLIKTTETDVKIQTLILG